jgi:hypothetical protein
MADITADTLGALAGTRLDEETVRGYLRGGAWRQRPLSGYLRDAVAAAPDRRGCPSISCPSASSSSTRSRGR